MDRINTPLRFTMTTIRPPNRTATIRGCEKIPLLSLILLIIPGVVILLQLIFIGQYYFTSSAEMNGEFSQSLQISQTPPVQKMYRANECWFSMIEDHKIIGGLFGVSLNMTKDKLCVSRYYKMRGLFQVLSDVARQANVTMVLGYGTLLSYHRYKDIMVSTYICWILAGEMKRVRMVSKSWYFSNMILYSFLAMGC